VVIRCHADEMSLTQADLEASLNWKRCPSTHGQVAIVFLFRCGVILSQSNFPLKVFTGFYRRHRLDFCGSFHVQIDSFLMYSTSRVALSGGVRSQVTSRYLPYQIYIGELSPT
jgi:hypothetical protein